MFSGVSSLQYSIIDDKIGKINTLKEIFFFFFLFFTISKNIFSRMDFPKKTIKQQTFLTEGKKYFLQKKKGKKKEEEERK